MVETYQEIVERFQKKYDQLQLASFNSFDQLEEGVELCYQCLQHLKRKVLLDGFQNEIEEIHFFKTQKTRPESYLYYLYKVRAYQLLLPQLDVDEQQQFLKKELRKINKFYAKHRELIYYMHRNRTDMDEYYFTRIEKRAYVKLKENRYRDRDFSTPYDMLWARIKTTQLYASFIEVECQHLKLQSNHSYIQRVKGKELKWTASKTALIELTYALYSNGAINHGKEDLKSIAVILEKVFHINLGNFYKTYAEMKARKGNRTRFLQDLVTDLQEKMKEDDAF
ncbi:RteC domain-containing protein [Galbibacter sp. BG1]